MTKCQESGFHGNPTVLYQKYLNAVHNAVKNGILTSDESKLIQAFVSEINSQDSITHQRKYGLANAIITIKKFFPSDNGEYTAEYGTCTTEDVIFAIEEYKNTTPWIPEIVTRGN